MAQVSLEVAQSAELKRLLKRLDNLRPVTSRYLRVVGLKVQGISRSKFLSGPRPGKLGVVTGRLRRSITVDASRVPDFVDVGTALIYGPVHEFGATIEARRAKFLAFKVDGEFRLAKSVKIPARPSLAPALAQIKPKLAGILLRELKRELRL